MFIYIYIYRNISTEIYISIHNIHTSKKTFFEHVIFHSKYTNTPTMWLRIQGAGIIYVSASDLGWQPIKATWMLRRPEINASRQARDPMC